MVSHQESFSPPTPPTHKPIDSFRSGIPSFFWRLAYGGESFCSHFPTASTCEKMKRSHFVFPWGLALIFVLHVQESSSTLVQTCRCPNDTCQALASSKSQTSPRAICQPLNKDGSCPQGHQQCVLSHIYGWRFLPKLANTISNVTFGLMLQDLQEDFLALGYTEQWIQLLQWWVVYQLPPGWTPILSAKDFQQVRLSNSYYHQILQAVPCSSIQVLTQYFPWICQQAPPQTYFIDAKSYFIGQRSNIDDSIPVSFSIHSQLVTPPSIMPKTSVPLGIYYLDSSIFASLSHSLEQNNAHVDIKSAAVQSTVKSFQVAQLEVEGTRVDNIHSALMWMDASEQTLLLSFSTKSNLALSLGRQPLKFSTCVNLDISATACPGPYPSPMSSPESKHSLVKIDASTSQATIKYNDKPISRVCKDLIAKPRVQVVNATYFCIQQIIPATCELGTGQFTVYVSRVKTSMKTLPDVDQVQPFDTRAKMMYPTWSVEMSIWQNQQVFGTECAPFVTHYAPTRSTPLSIYSIASIVFYSLALVASVFILHTNTFRWKPILMESSQFWSNVTSITVILYYTLIIFNNVLWIGILSKNMSHSGMVYFMLANIAYALEWTLLTSMVLYWLRLLLPSWRAYHTQHVRWFVAVNGLFYMFIFMSILGGKEFFRCTYNWYMFESVNNNNKSSTNASLPSDSIDDGLYPDLEPMEWKDAAQGACSHETYADSFFVVYAMLHGVVALTSLVCCSMLVYLQYYGFPSSDEFMDFLSTSAAAAKGSFFQGPQGFDNTRRSSTVSVSISFCTQPLQHSEMDCLWQSISIHRVLRVALALCSVITVSLVVRSMWFIFGYEKVLNVQLVWMYYVFNVWLVSIGLPMGSLLTHWYILRHKAP